MLILNNCLSETIIKFGEILERLQPTRMTDHIGSFIDNMYFLHSIKHTTLSGNIITDISDYLPSLII